MDIVLRNTRPSRSRLPLLFLGLLLLLVIPLVISVTTRVSDPALYARSKQEILGEVTDLLADYNRDTDAVALGNSLRKLQGILSRSGDLTNAQLALAEAALRQIKVGKYTAAGEVMRRLSLSISATLDSRASPEP